MTRLIVNADDFGLTPGVNRAILELHRANVLTSTTLMAKASATDEALTCAQTTPTLGVGCHVVLVDGDPILDGAAIPSLVDAKTRRFHPTLGAFLARLLTGRISAAEIEAEAAAQIALLRSRGLRLTHLDTHKHTHMFPAVLRPVLRAARTAGIRAVRNPFEPIWSIRATPGAPSVRRAQVRLLRVFEPTFRRTVAQEGFATTDGTLGILATGTLNIATLASLLKSLPSGCFELISHPGYNDAALAQAHTRLLASREIERTALESLAAYSKIELVSFASLTRQEGAAFA